MMLMQSIFYFLVFLAGISALGLLFVKNVFHAALFFLVCLLSIAGLYVFLYAEFVAVTQILIYAGGILIIIIFGIMLTSKLSGKALQAGSTNILSGVLAGSALLGVLIYGMSKYLPVSSPSLSPAKPIETIGITLLTTHALPFEIAGILLLVSLIGAAVITSFMKTRKM